MIMKSKINLTDLLSPCRRVSFVVSTYGALAPSHAIVCMISSLIQAMICRLVTQENRYYEHKWYKGIECRTQPPTTAHLVVDTRHLDGTLFRQRKSCAYDAILLSELFPHY